MFALAAAAVFTVFLALVCLTSFLAVATALRAFAATASLDCSVWACLTASCGAGLDAALVFFPVIGYATTPRVRVPKPLLYAQQRCDSALAICQNQSMNLVARSVAMLAGAVHLSICSAAETPLPNGAFQVLNSWPHSIEDSTQGLEFVGDHLLESTGRYGESRILLRDWRTGELILSYSLAAQVFGEGVTRVGERFWQLSWRTGRGWIYDRKLQPVATFSYPGQGWGLCHDGTRLIRSDGSDQLFFHSAENFSALGSIKVQLAGAPVHRLNELECVAGTVYANVWQSDWVLQIAPGTGEVLRRWNLESLRYRFRPPENFSPTEDVLNGIAFHPQRRSFFVTGKRWPVMFEVDLFPNTEVDTQPP